MIFPDCVPAICWQELRQPLTFSNWKCQAWAMSEFFFLRIFSNNYFCLFFRKSSHSEWETFLHFILKNSFSSANIAETDFELLSNIKTPVRLQFKIWTQNNNELNQWRKLDLISQNASYMKQIWSTFWRKYVVFIKQFIRFFGNIWSIKLLCNRRFYAWSYLLSVKVYHD